MAIAMGWQKPPNVAGSSAPAIMVGLFVATAGLLFGYDTGAINGILGMSSFKQQFSTGYIASDGSLGISPIQTSIIVAILSAGTIVGSLFAAPVGDRFGRRISLIGSIGVFCIGVIFQVCASNIPLLLIGRFWAGVGVGVVSVLVPLYQSEMAPRWIRGTLVCAYQLSITTGLLAASIVNIITCQINSNAAYRIPMGLQFVWGTIVALGLLVLPETPRYLIKTNKNDAAALSLSRLRRLDITHPAIVEELAEIEANHQYELSLGPDTYREIVFGSPHLGRRLLTGCGLQMLQQLTGVNFIMYYGTTFFNGAGISNSFTISLIMQVINMVSTFFGLMVVETWGRRKLLMVGAAGMGICQLLIASFCAASGGSNKVVQNQILLIFISIFIFLFAASWGPVVWVVTSEIFPLKARAKSMSISTASNWLLNFGIAFGVPYMVGPSTQGATADWGPKVFFLFGACCIIAVFFVWCMVYETSKMSLEQIDEMYERVDYAWNSNRFEPSWSFQQMRDFGFSDSGVPPEENQMVITPLEPAHTNSTVQTSHPDSGVSVHNAEPPESKMVSELGNVDFSY